MCCWLWSRFSGFDALLKGTCVTVECLVVVQLEGEYSEFGVLAVMTSMLDLFLVVASRLTVFTALLKGFPIFRFNFRLTLLLFFYIILPPPFLSILSPTCNKQQR